MKNVPGIKLLHASTIHVPRLCYILTINGGIQNTNMVEVKNTKIFKSFVSFFLHKLCSSRSSYCCTRSVYLITNDTCFARLRLSARPAYSCVPWKVALQAAPANRHLLLLFFPGNAGAWCPDSFGRCYQH